MEFKCNAAGNDGPRGTLDCGNIISVYYNPDGNYVHCRSTRAFEECRIPMDSNRLSFFINVKGTVKAFPIFRGSRLI